MLIFHILLLLFSFYVLAVLTEEFFVPSLDHISKRLKLSSEAAGATLMAIGSSSPEFFTSLFAVLRPNGFADIGAGTIVGSAIFNILVIVGVAATFKRTHLTWHVTLRDLGFYIISILALLIAFMDGNITLSEAFMFVVLYLIYVSAAVNWKKWFKPAKESVIEEIEETVKKNPITKFVVSALTVVIPHPKKHVSYYMLTFTLSIFLIAFLSHILVDSAVYIGETLSISHTIIALTVLAAGTSIPDLLSSVVVAKQGRGDMAIGNAVGSNVFDILFGLGFPWMLVILMRGGTVSVGTENLLSSIFLLFATVIALLFLLIARKWNISRRAGMLLVALYFIYLGFNILKIQGF